MSKPRSYAGRCLDQLNRKHSFAPLGSFSIEFFQFWEDVAGCSLQNKNWHNIVTLPPKNLFLGDTHKKHIDSPRSASQRKPEAPRFAIWHASVTTRNRPTKSPVGSPVRVCPARARGSSCLPIEIHTKILTHPSLCSTGAPCNSPVHLFRPWPKVTNSLSIIF